MDLADPDSTIISALFVTAGVLFVATGTRPIGYGRYPTAGLGPGMPPRLAWFLMALPGLAVFGHVAWNSPSVGRLVPTIMMVFWLVHYTYRGLIYPVLLRAAPGRRFPVVLVVAGIAMCTLLSYVNARAVSGFGRDYPLRWLWSVRFLYGSMLFAVGFAINRYADWALCRLSRSDGEHPLPRGGVFEEIACPNYLGEIMMWLGWAILTWSAAGFAAATVTLAILIPRGYSHHLWYQRMHRDYPPSRRAVIPLLL